LKEKIRRGIGQSLMGIIYDGHPLAEAMLGLQKYTCIDAMSS